MMVFLVTYVAPWLHSHCHRSTRTPRHIPSTFTSAVPIARVAAVASLHTATDFLGLPGLPSSECLHVHGALLMPTQLLSARCQRLSDTGSPACTTTRVRSRRGGCSASPCRCHYLRAHCGQILRNSAPASTTSSTCGILQPALRLMPLAHRLRCLPPHRTVASSCALLCSRQYHPSRSIRTLGCIIKAVHGTTNLPSTRGIHSPSLVLRSPARAS
jgi:hypothetical protein